MDRRTFLQEIGGGLGGVALNWLLADEARAQGMHHPAKAKRVVQIFLSGAASQVDSFDYKPLLIERRGQKFDPGGTVELFQSQPGVVTPSYWGWKRYGQSGRWVSDLFPHIGSCADDIAMVHSMVSKSNVHGPATFLQNTGFVLPGFPSFGAWVSYGLGSLNRDLPTFVVMPDPRGVPPNGPANWGAGFLPASAQGTAVNAGGATPIHDLYPADPRFADADPDTRAFVARQNRRYGQSRPGDSRLDARIQSYELAARLQLSAPKVLDLTGESAATKSLYGMDQPHTEEFGRRCLIARRMLERGVRFVQLWSGADNGFPRRNWDSHEDLARDHGDMAGSMDKPVAGLLKDLKARGLLRDTIVVFATEFGRMPCSQGGKGRDHNPDAFTLWMAGGGVKGGATYGASDEWSYRVAENPTSNYDIHATLLHLMGIDHTKLSVRNNGIDRRLTDVHGKVLKELIA